jgi:opacity protein-like surface antigen
MKKYLLVAALAVAAASPAFAASHKNLNRDNAWVNQNYAYAAPDSTTVVSGGQILGRDPDVAVRTDLMREGDATAINGN